METALSTISVLPSEKLELAMFTRKLKAEILVNDRDPLAILKQLKFIEKTIADVLTDSDIENHFLNEAEKYTEKTFDHLGIKFTVQEVGTKYQYDASGDAIWFDLQKEMELLKEKLKERETYLKSIPIEGTVCPVHGNFLTRPPKTSKTKVTVRI
jgi:ABC-type hemin transport system substrate-binding protein